MVWACPSVHLSVCPCVRYTCTRSRTIRDKILKFGMKIKKTLNYFSCISDLSLQRYCPFQSVSCSLHCKHMEACEQNISRTA